MPFSVSGLFLFSCFAPDLQVTPLGLVDSAFGFVGDAWCRGVGQARKSRVKKDTLYIEMTELRHRSTHFGIGKRVKFGKLVKFGKKGKKGIGKRPGFHLLHFDWTLFSMHNFD